MCSHNVTEPVSQGPASDVEWAVAHVHRELSARGHDRALDAFHGALAEAKAEQARIIRQLARQADAYRHRHPDEVA